MTRVVVDESPINVNVAEDIYSVVVDGDGVTIEVRDSIIREVNPEEEVYDIEIDTSVANTTYVGQASPGTATSQSLWRIKRITETSTGSSVDWAGGVADFIHVWDNHLALTYGP